MVFLPFLATPLDVCINGDPTLLSDVAPTLGMPMAGSFHFGVFDLIRDGILPSFGIKVRQSDFPVIDEIDRRR